MPDFFALMFTGPFGVFFGVFFILVLVLIIANWVRMARSGINPFTAQATLIAKLAHSELLSSEKSIESRLLELDRLLASGTISTEEHKAARLKILSS